MLFRSSGRISFKFEYAITAPNTLMTDVKVQGSQVDIDLPTGYVAKTCFTASPATFTIPASSLKNNSYVNFRLERLDSNYTADVGVVGISWKIG